MRTRVFDRLQTETRRQADVADADALSYVADCSCERLREYLVKSYGFEAPLESACAMTQALTSHNATSCPRTRYIAHDLVALGFPPERLLELEPCHLGRFRDLGEALGWVYVAERNVVTNARCHRHLAKHAPDLAARATYLNCYGAATDARWQRFGIVLERAAERADAARITAAAIESYAFLHRWLSAQP